MPSSRSSRRWSSIAARRRPCVGVRPARVVAAWPADAWQSVVDIAGGLGLGFEAFGEIEKIANDPPSRSEQEHRIGPVALFETELGERGEIGIELGFLFGLTDETPDDTFKFNVEYEWGPEGEEGRRLTTIERGHRRQPRPWSRRSGGLV